VSSTSFLSLFLSSLIGDGCLNRPALLRSNSPLMSSLSCYLQCLYAIKSWRNCLLGWRKPKQEREGEGMLVDFGQNENEEERDGEEGEEGEGFNGYWKGDQPYELGGIGRGNQEELVQHVWLELMRVRFLRLRCTLFVVLGLGKPPSSEVEEREEVE